jgi:lipopolysaccharide export system protein LptC
VAAAHEPASSLARGPLAGALGRWRLARRWIPTVLLIALALFTAWLVERGEDPAPPPAPAGRQNPDYYLENFSTTSMDVTGRRTRTLAAERLLHFPDTDTNELLEPYLIVYHPTRPPWHIRSERGWVSAAGDVVLLLGKVHGWREDEAGNRVLDIRTSDLRILPDSEYAETDKPVVIRDQNSETHGIGMRAFLEESRVELLARVVTTYTPD